MTARSAVVVADDEHVTRACWRGLAMAGYQVRICGAEVSAADLRPSPDVVVCDATVQDASGVALLQRMRDASPTSLLLAVTPEDAMAAIAARRDGADGVIAYSRDARRLAERTSSTLQQVLSRVDTGVAASPEPTMAPPTTTRRSGRATSARAPREGLAGTALQSRPTARDSDLELASSRRAPTTRAVMPGSAEPDPRRHDDLLLRLAVRANAATAASASEALAEIVLEVSARLDAELLMAFALPTGASSGARALAGAQRGAALDRIAVTRVGHGLELGWLLQRAQQRASVFAQGPEELPLAALPLRQALARQGYGPLAAVPIAGRRGALGVLIGLRRAGAAPWDGAAVRACETVADLCAGLCERATAAPAATRTAGHPGEAHQAVDVPVQAASSLARELGVALATLDGNVRILVDGLGPARAQELRAVAAAADNARALAQHLRVFESGARLEAVAAHLNDFAVECEPLLRAVAGGLPVSVTTEAGACWATFDPLALERLLVRVVVAARNNGGSRGGARGGELGGIVLRTVDEAPLGGGWIGLELGLVHGRVGGADGDFGRVLDPEVGAALVAEAHAAGFRLARIDQPGLTAFRVTLAAQRTRASRRRTSQRLQEAGAGARVLVVEDEPTLRKMVVRVISRLGHDVQEATSAEEASELVALHSEPLTLLITDVCLPHRTGPALARELRQAGRVREILFMSGYADEEAITREFGAAVGLLHKPFRQHDLAERVRALLEAA